MKYNSILPIAVDNLFSLMYTIYYFDMPFIYFLTVYLTVKLFPIFYFFPAVVIINDAPKNILNGYYTLILLDIQLDMKHNWSNTLTYST